MPPRKPALSILLIEDDPADAVMFTELLEEVAPDVEVYHAEHGQQALQYLSGQGPHGLPIRPGLIILDLNMPVMSGPEFLSAAKFLDGIKRIPVLILSTSDRAEDIERSYDAQAAGYIVKPGNYAQYLEMLNIIKQYWTGVVRLPTLEEAAGTH